MIAFDVDFDWRPEQYPAETAVEELV